MENISIPKRMKISEENSYHDSLSWRVWPRLTTQFLDVTNSMRSIYLRDMGLNADIGLRDRRIGDGFGINNCTENYKAILFEGLNRGNQRGYRTDILHNVGDWAKGVCEEGRVIFEIVSIYSKESHQFVGFMLQHLDNSFCRRVNDYVVFNAPFTNDDRTTKAKKVKIPLSKCIVIDFPQEKGGYRGFHRKVSQVLALGEQFERLDPQNPSASLVRTKKWEREFKRITSDWGNKNLDDCNDYYQLMSLFRFNYTALLCTVQAMNEFKKLLAYLNGKLNENAELVFTVNRYDTTHFLRVQKEWANGNMSYKNARDFLLYFG
jgi:hypothetical protein